MMGGYKYPIIFKSRSIINRRNRMKMLMFCRRQSRFFDETISSNTKISQHDDKKEKKIQKEKNNLSPQMGDGKRKKRLVTSH